MMLHEWTHKLEFLHEFFENFKPNWQGTHRENKSWHVTVHPKFEFLHAFFKIPNQIGRASWKHDYLACDCAPLCQILGHLNNARWINGPQVANWSAWGTWLTHIVPQL